jgi:very-short-patch-repair endonuclease
MPVADNRRISARGAVGDTVRIALPWHLFEALQGKDVTTLAWTRPFQVVSVTPTSIRVFLRETKGVRYVQRVEMEKTLAALNEKGSLTIEEVRYLAPKTSSYVAALVARVPGVTWDGAKRRLVTATAGDTREAAAGSSYAPLASGPAMSLAQPRQARAAIPVSLDALWTEQAGEVLGVWQKLNPMVQRELAAMALADVSQTLQIVRTCESPPEQLLAARLLSVARSVSMVEDFELEPQHHVQTRTGQVRVDLLVTGRVGGTFVRLAVECDGHTYHGKTNEQAAHDRQRDRDLRLEGYDVVRFAATEIMDDPEECALEVFRQMLARPLPEQNRPAR